MHMRGTYLSNLIAQSVGRFLSLCANFWAYVYIARHFGPDNLGKYTYVLNFFSLAIILVEFGTNSVLAKQLVQVKQDEAPIYWGNLLLFRLFVYLMFLIPILAIAIILRPDLFPLLLWGTLALPFLSSRFFEPLYQIYGRPWFSALPNILYSVAWLVLIVSVIFISSSLNYLIAAYIFANITYTILAFYLAFRLLRPKLKIRRDYIKRIIHLAAPIWVSSLFGTLNFRINIFMLSSMQSDIAVGFYSVPFRFLEMTVLFGVVLMNPLIPIFSEMAVQGLGKLKIQFSLILEIVAVIIIPVAVMAPFISENIIELFFGYSFMETSSVLNIMSWIGVLVFLNLLLSTLCLALGVVRHGYWNTASALIISIVFNYIFIAKFGYIGCAWAALGSEVFLFCVVIYYVLNRIGNFINFPKWLYIFGGNFIFFIILNIQILNVNKVTHIILAIGTYVSIIYYLKIIELPDILKRIKVKR